MQRKQHINKLYIKRCGDGVVRIFYVVNWLFGLFDFIGRRALDICIYWMILDNQPPRDVERLVLILGISETLSGMRLHILITIVTGVVTNHTIWRNKWMPHVSRGEWWLIPTINSHYMATHWTITTKVYARSSHMSRVAHLYETHTFTARVTPYIYIKPTLCRHQQTRSFIDTPRAREHIESRIDKLRPHIKYPSARWRDAACVSSSAPTPSLGQPRAASLTETPETDSNSDAHEIIRRRASSLCTHFSWLTNIRY